LARGAVRSRAESVAKARKRLPLPPRLGSQGDPARARSALSGRFVLRRWHAISTRPCLIFGARH